MIFTIVRKIAQDAGIQKISPHLSAFFATHLLENGADLRSIQLMMGHENITTTEVYMHVDTQHLSKSLQAFHPRNTLSTHNKPETFAVNIQNFDFTVLF